MSARRYLTVIQDARGYPPPGGELDPAPPEGPVQPVLHSVVLADEFDHVEAERDELRALLAEAEPFIGWLAEVPDLKRRVREVLEPGGGR